MSPSFVSTFLTFGVFVSAYSKSDSAVNPLGRDTSNTTMFDCFSIVSSSFGLKLKNGKMEATVFCVAANLSHLTHTSKFKWASVDRSVSRGFTLNEESASESFTL